MAEHAGTELFDNSFKDDFIHDHLLLEELDVEIMGVFSVSCDLYLHVLENCSEVSHVEEGHTDVLVGDHDAREHGPLYDSVKNVRLLKVRAGAIDAADEN